VLPGSKAADHRKNARDRNVNANSANARSKAVVAVNKAVVSKADDKPGYVGLINGGRRLPPFCLLGYLKNEQRDQ